MIRSDRTGQTMNDEYPYYDVRLAPVLTTEEARQGEVSGHVRWVLVTSLMLAAIAGAILIAISA